MKKFLVSAYDATYGNFGGIRSEIVEASSEEAARSIMQETYGKNLGKGMDSSDPYGIKVQETDLDSPPELPEHWQ